MKALVRSLIAACFCCWIASAVTVLPCSNCWQAFNPGSVVDGTGNNGNPYWVNSSQDGANRGLAFQLSQYLPLSSYSTGGVPPYDTPRDFYFTNTPGEQLQVQFLMGQTIDGLEFGWYDTNSPNTLHPLITRTGTAAATVANPTSAMFTPTDAFGFYLKYLNVPIPGNICASLVASGVTTVNASAFSCYTQAPLLHTNQVVYTQSSLNSAGPNSEVQWEQVSGNVPSYLTPYHQHFVVLRNPTTGALIIGAEDAFGRDSVQNNWGVYEGNGDYQDLALMLTPAVAPLETPEPATFVLAGLGLAAFGFYRRRRA